jgi:alpha-beta hydrolase superfamily lysophospholipase
VLELGDGYRTQVYHHHRTPGGPEHLGVLYLHGIQSHPGWFFASAGHLGQCGYEVFQVTRRGSGANRIARGHARSAQQLLQDLEAATEYVLSRTGSDRMHLVGVSWGGKLAVSYAGWTQHRGRIASLTLIAPGIVPKVDVSPATKLGIAMCLLALGRKGFAIPLNEPQLFTDNEPMREFLRRDPLRLRRASARFLYASRCLDRLLARAPEGVLRMPVTLIQAACDRIMDNEATARVVMRLTAGRAGIHELPGAHTLEFEPDPARFFDVLREACRQRNS